MPSAIRGGLNKKPFSRFPISATSHESSSANNAANRAARADSAGGATATPGWPVRHKRVVIPGALFPYCQQFSWWGWWGPAAPLIPSRHRQQRLHADPMANYPSTPSVYDIGVTGHYEEGI